MREYSYIICKQCGFKKRVPPNQSNRSFCSKSCWYEFRKISNTREIIKIDDNTAKIIINSKKYGLIEVLIDIEDIEKVKNYRWNIRLDRGLLYYIHAKDNNKTILLHRLIMDTPKHLEVDHINRNTLDNRKHNLRNCTREVNQANKLGLLRISKRNSSGCVGVCFLKRENKWQASFKNIKLGYFDTKEEAIECRTNFNNKILKESRGL